LLIPIIHDRPSARAAGARRRDVHVRHGVAQRTAPPTATLSAATATAAARATGTPLPRGLQPITAANAGRLALLAWLGTAGSPVFSPDGTLLAMAAGAGIELWGIAP
jgi:hypothetical protein